MQATFVIVETVQQFDWGMLTAMCAVVALGGEALRRSIGSEVRKQLQQQDDRMSARFASKELITEQHGDHDRRIVALESNLVLRRNHGD